MANAASTIEIELEIRDAINRLGKLEGELKKSSSAMDRVANSTRKMESAFRSAKNAASALVAAISVQQIAQAADTFTNFANQIRIATNSAAEAAAVQKELYRVSQTTGTAIEDTTKLYARLRVAADQLGSSQAETIRITEIVAKSLAAAGTSSTEASGALLQLAQALNSPKVQAEEFNSLIDGMPNLLKEVEKQLGLTAGSLKKFVTDGNLTNQLFKDAILGSAEAINEQFGAAQDTIGTATQRINNSLTMLIGKFEQSTGIFNKTANALTKLATEFDKADNIVRQFSEVVVMLGVYFDKLKQLALALTKPLRDAFSVFSGGTSNPIAKTINYIQYSLSLLTVAVDYNTQNLAIRLERLAYQIRDFFIGMVANLLSFFESVDNFFINQINKVIGYYNSAADSIGMDGDVAPIATSTSARESELKFERDSAEFLADSYRRQADLLRQAEEAYAAVNAEFNQYTQQIDSGTLLKTEEQLGNVDLEAKNAASSVENAASSVEKLKEKVEELEKIKYTDFTGQISEAQQEEFTRQLEEQFRIRTELGQLTEDQQNRFTQALEEEFERVTEINALTQQTNDLYEARLFPKARELEFLQEVTEELKTQLLIYGQLSEEAERTAGAIVSGVSGAGPNASRATNIAQSKSIEEAAAKLILSNEKVAKAIDKSFEILFDTIDPLIDILGDLINAINRLIGALLENVTSGIENALDQIGLGPNSYLFGGGFTQDIESVIGGSGYSSPDSVAIQQLSFEELVAAFPEDELILRINNAIQKGTTQLAKDDPLIQTLIALAQDSSFEEVMQQVSATIEEVRKVQEVVANFTQSDVDELMAPANQLVEAITKTLPAAIAEANVPESLDTLEEITETAIRQTEAIEFQNLTVEEQIQFRYDEAIATIEQQRALADLINDEELRSQLLDSVNRATQAQNDLLEKQQEELQKLNEEREREARLLAIQNIETGLQGLLRDFERTIEDIGDLVQGLFDQVNDLLFSEFNLASPKEAFAIASDEYQDLLAKAFEPEATEEDIKNLQGFVNEYLSASRDVYKSSSAFQEIFDNVLQDLTKLGISYGFNAPINAVSGLQKDLETILVDLPEDLQQAVSDLISGLNLAATAFAQQQVEFLTTVYQIPLTLNKENFNVSLPIVELGEIQVDFDTYEFANELGLLNLNVENGINNLNTKISSAVNSFIQTINNASSAVESGGTATPVETVTQSGTNQSGEVYTPPTYATKIYELAASGSMIDYTSVSDLSNSDAYFYIARSATNHGSTTVEDYAKAFVSSYEDAFGVGAAAKFKYGLYADFGQSRYFIGYTDTTEGIQARDSNYEAYKNYSTKYGFRQGGLVPDPKDTIPAMLSPGEYILSPETVRRYGVSNLNRLNSGDSAAINATSDPEVKRLLAELIVAVRENDTEVNVYTDMQGQTKAGIEEFRSELRERTRRQGDQYIPARYI